MSPRPVRRPVATAIAVAVALVGSAVGIGSMSAGAAVHGQQDEAQDAATAPGAAVFAAAQNDTVATTPSERTAEGTDDVPDEADMVFAAMMIPHHQQAVELAGILGETPGIDVTSTALAAFIARDQTAEIAQMTAWLDAWHRVGIMDHEHVGVMQGMATPAQIAQLDALEGVAAEKLFLELMIAHHEGALAMTRTVLLDGSNSWIRALAKHVASEQQREIDAMTVRLELL